MIIGMTVDNCGSGVDKRVFVITEISITTK